MRGHLFNHYLIRLVNRKQVVALFIYINFVFTCHFEIPHYLSRHVNSF